MHINRDTQERMRKEWDERAQAGALHFNSPSRQAGEYDTFFENGKRFVETQLMPEVEQLQGHEGMWALEIGCGLGRMMRPLAPLFAQVHGVDVSPSMVEEAKALTPAGGFPNLSFQANDGATLPFGQASMGFVFSTGVFTHLPSRAVFRSYVSEIARVLLPGGRFRIEVPVNGGWWRIKGMIPVPRLIRPFVPRPLFGLVRRAAIRNPMKRSATYMGVSFYRFQIAGLLRHHGLTGELTEFPGGRGHTVG